MVMSTAQQQSFERALVTVVTSSFGDIDYGFMAIDRWLSRVDVRQVRAAPCGCIRVALCV
eukprot:scaffold31023_cov65-Phaeocystis_antarctica.AAC.1